MQNFCPPRKRESFNPTLVRLRRAGHRGRADRSVEFQSHAGSIEAPPHPDGGDTAVWGFQSHAGSIEATYKEAFSAIGVSCFNPTLVRLRPFCDYKIPQNSLSFQSHAGSIEAPMDKLEIREVEMVSIPRWFD